MPAKNPHAKPLKSLNKKLAVIEKQIQREKDRLARCFDRRLAKRDDFITGYKPRDVIVTFCKDQGGGQNSQSIEIVLEAGLVPQFVPGVECTLLRKLQEAFAFDGAALLLFLDGCTALISVGVESQKKACF